MLLARLYWWLLEYVELLFYKDKKVFHSFFFKNFET